MHISGTNEYLIQIFTYFFFRGCLVARVARDQLGDDEQRHQNPARHTANFLSQTDGPREAGGVTHIKYQDLGPISRSCQSEV